MRILSIDSSSPSGSIAILEDNRIINQKTYEGNSTYSNTLLSLIDKVLSESHNDLYEMEGFSLTIGPGSFTGLRVGVSLIKGIVLATQKPFVGVNTLQALAALVEPTQYLICPILDARKKELYSAFFKNKNGQVERHFSDRVLPPEELVNMVSEPTFFIGPGLESYGKFLSQSLGSLFVKTTKLKNHSIAASAGLIALTKFVDGVYPDLDSLKINYLRKPEAEINLT